MAFIFLLALSLLLQGALGELVCEDLPVSMCSFAIASSGNRCLLETSTREDSTKGTLYCKTSKAIATAMNEYIEMDSCISACGLDRMAVGISSDNLLDSRFTKTLCSSSCLNRCPNILDLYHNLALGEGMYLPELCTRVKAASRRELGQSLAAEPPSSPESIPVSEVMNESKPEAASDAAADPSVSVEAALAKAPAAARHLLSGSKYIAATKPV